MNASRRPLLPALGLISATALLAGCGLGTGGSPTGVTLTVTADFGAHVVQRVAAPKLTGTVTVMQLTARSGHVTTRRGRDFVQSIDGKAAQDAGRERLNWFYYVNGILAPQGAAQTDLHSGDSVWWDLHDWSATADIPAVVGSYPEPFAHGSAGKRFPITIYCIVPSGAACRTVAARLLSIGVAPAFGGLGTDEPQTLRVLVGTWASLRTDAAASSLAGGPAASGVYVRFDRSGTALTLLAADGHAVRTLHGGAGLVAATSLPNEAPTWLITGTDAAGVDRAARALTARALHDHFALAVYPGADLPVPVVAGP